MKYSPKLKNAMQQIKNIMDANDIGGIVILHTPGYSEFLNKINPKYSCLFYEKVPHPDSGEMVEGMRFRAKEEEIGKEARDKKISDTANMLVHLNDISGQIVLQNMQAQELFETKFKIDKGGGGFSSLESQMN